MPDFNTQLAPFLFLLLFVVVVTAACFLGRFCFWKKGLNILRIPNFGEDCGEENVAPGDRPQFEPSAPPPNYLDLTHEEPPSYSNVIGRTEE